MSFGPEVIGAFIPITAIVSFAYLKYLKHVRLMAEINARSGNVIPERSSVSGDVRAELEELREEVRRLRDTSTKFDLSFDAGLTRLEDRVERLEIEKTTTKSYSSPQTDGDRILIGR